MMNVEKKCYKKIKKWKSLKFNKIKQNTSQKTNNLLMNDL